MKTVVAILALMSISNVFSCDDIELKNSSIKADIYYQYAPFGKAEVVKDHVMYSTNRAHGLTINFEEKPYVITIALDIHTSSIDNQKVIELAYTFRNTDNEQTYSNSKIVKLENGSKKISIYDWKHGRKMNFVFKDFLEIEWQEMSCPNELPNEETKTI